MKLRALLPMAGIMAAALILPTGADTTENTANISELGDTTYITVNGSYSGDDAPEEVVYSVDISWGSMEATYYAIPSGYTWDPKTHTYSSPSTSSTSGGQWVWTKNTGDTLEGNEIQVINHSNALITCSLSFTAGSSVDGYGIEGEFSQPSFSIPSAANHIGGVNHPNLIKSSQLTLSGSLGKDFTDTTELGVITVTIQ